MKKERAVVCLQVPRDDKVYIIRLVIIGYVNEYKGWKYVLHKTVSIKDDVVMTKNRWVASEVNSGIAIINRSFKTRNAAVSAINKVIDDMGNDDNTCRELIKHVAEYGSMPEHVGTLNTTIKADSVSIHNITGEVDRYAWHIKYHSL